MIFKSHLISMIIYAFFVCIVLSLIRRGDKKDRIRYGITLFLIMVTGSLAFGWFMSIFL